MPKIGLGIPAENSIHDMLDILNSTILLGGIVSIVE